MKKAVTPLLAFWARQLLLHSSKNVLATTRHYFKHLKAHPETKQWKHLVSDEVWQNQKPSCSDSSIPRQYSEAEIRWSRNFRVKDDLSKEWVPMIKEELNENTKAGAVLGIFAWIFFQIWTWSLTENKHLGKHLLRGQWQKKSTSDGSWGLLQAWTVTTARLISPCCLAFNPKDFGFKGKELFWHSQIFLPTSNHIHIRTDRKLLSASN